VRFEIGCGALPVATHIRTVGTASHLSRELSGTGLDRNPDPALPWVVGAGPNSCAFSQAGQELSFLSGWQKLEEPADQV
jgi:hypothetical protein